MSNNEIDELRSRFARKAMAMMERRGEEVSRSRLAAEMGIARARIDAVFPDEGDLLDAVTAEWFAPKLAVMDEVMATDLPPRRKMYEFYARRFVMMRDSWREDPLSFKMSVELGEAHFELVRSYVDLGDHYLGMIIAEAMADGHFEGLEIDEAISLVNQMVSVYCNIGAMLPVMERLSEEKLARIVDAMFDGLSAQDRGARGVKGLRAA